MAEGRSEEAWNHTAALLAMLANCHRDPCHAVVINADCMWQWSRVDEYGEIWYLEVYGKRGASHEARQAVGRYSQPKRLATAFPPEGIVWLHAPK